jgi:imidazole glycerol-phosphate synthase subunit HisH
MIAIIDYNTGNTLSVQNALDRLGCKSLITDDVSVIAKSDKVILPGVGEASTAMRHLREKGLDRIIKDLKQPVLGICLGLQLMCRFSEEGETECLGIFNASVLKFPPCDRVPHMGWNNLMMTEGPLFRGIDCAREMYFVHSYYAELCDQTAALTNYILSFSSALQRDNFFATQFHPEKSGEAGSSVLKNFIEL